MREKMIDLAHNYFDSVPWYADIADLNPEELIDHLIANGVTIPVRCKDCKHYVFPDEFDVLGLCLNERLCVSCNGEVYPKENYYCAYGERK